MDETRILGCADLLRQAMSGPLLAALPDALAPRNEAEAYAVQTALLGTDRIGGWKVGAVHAPGPFTPSILPEALPDARLPASLAAPEVEVELALILQQDLDPRDRPWTASEVAPALGSACTAIEILNSRFESRVAAAPLAALADLGSNGAVRLGQPVEGWQDWDLTTLAATMTLDGERQVAQGNATLTQTLTAVAWLADHAAARGLPLRRGQFILTGARLGPFRARPGQSVEARFGPLPPVDLIC